MKTVKSEAKTCENRKKLCKMVRNTLRSIIFLMQLYFQKSVYTVTIGFQFGVAYGT